MAPPDAATADIAPPQVSHDHGPSSPPAAAATADMQRPKYSIMDTAALAQVLTEHRIKLHPHVENIQRHYILHGMPLSVAEIDWSRIANLPKAVGPLLAAHFGLVTTVTQTNRSADGYTTKLLVKLPSGSLVETVIMRYDRHQRDVDGDDTASIVSTTQGKPRTTVCLSSQVGCKMGCSFCATGTMGFTANLTAAEIIEQLVHAHRVQHVDHVVFMGMGEPGQNIPAVFAAIQTMTNRRILGLAPRNICVSTVGVLPLMHQLLDECPGVNLALSLHAPTQEIRNEIVPSAKVYPLDALMAAVDAYIARNKRILIEYILIKDVNCSVPAAHELGKLLAPRARGVIVNLIPYNPTETGRQYVPPTHDDVAEFETICRQEYGLRTTVRRTMGQDIDGACGQLVVKEQRKGRAAKKLTAAAAAAAAAASPSSCSDRPAVDVEDLAVAPAAAPDTFERKIGRVIKRRSSPGRDDTPAAADDAARDGDSGKDFVRDWLPVGLAALAGVLVTRVVWKLATRRRR
ncbi:23S rRNA methyltransferase [Allomyces macrogynus ATCC 38327]|uniref:23S rRNA methyltransferase n=1 Tax=Allomyces macrogynus (strain ATCC 38327) TaxID=578462 RepID=A0A0L0S5P8_ALLM3|nr:23S rRNA methyltransferase [Allomyces macrogynus ATCC 38327]|eukprot:KNE57780.1 23S rRNA methyltransferase [Allomyces macrogynus ATCC 38327]